ncbi:MAG: STAS domain-containing protein [Bryobacteraceae bacterium]
MKTNSAHLLAEILKDEESIVKSWVQQQVAATTNRPDLISEAELRRESTEFLKVVRRAVESGKSENVEGTAWTPVRELLAEISRSRARQGFTPGETATFVLSLKQPVFQEIQRRLAENGAAAVSDELWTATVILDKLALLTTEFYQKGREEVIQRQQRELLELSTPVVKLWGGILALPVIGTLDSERTQIVMESLLQQIVETGASIAIIDITGVPTVDTLVAQHLLKTVAAAGLMGAECIISGIRPQIAATIVHLGVDLSAVITKASLADAFSLALSRLGLKIQAAPKRSAQGTHDGTDSDT